MGEWVCVWVRGRVSWFTGLSFTSSIFNSTITTSGHVIWPHVTPIYGLFVYQVYNGGPRVFRSRRFTLQQNIKA